MSAATVRGTGTCPALTPDRPRPDVGHAALFLDPDHPTAPVVAFWCDGFAVDLDLHGLDAVLPRLDALTARLRRLRAVLAATQN
ncbi:hypothetical protein [Streptomyces sp. GSL17-111]|uniref:hypothetical protein n=1 Tax=Streptomyces sp. GSL17-111 TaxID=3121596 RepID=UPI0030F3932A